MRGGEDIIKYGIIGMLLFMIFVVVFSLLSLSKPLYSQPEYESVYINFQPTESEIPEGYEVDDGSIYDPIRGFGWDVDRTSDTRERNMNSDQRLDTLIYQCCENEPHAFWGLDIHNGIYEVTVSIGDPMFSHYNQNVKIEGEVFIQNMSTGVNKFIIKTKNVTINDGQLNLEMWGHYQDDLNAGIALNYINIVLLSVQATNCGDIIYNDTILENDLLGCMGNGLIIASENITLDCNGHLIQTNDNGYTGIWLNNTGITIKNCEVSGFVKGIQGYFYTNIVDNHVHDTTYGISSSQSNIMRNSLIDNIYGIYITYYTNLTNNYLENNSVAISIDYGYGNKGINNTLYFNGIGVDSLYSLNNTFWNNKFDNNGSNAFEVPSAYGNIWNLSNIGNYWSDFINNVGHPNYYKVNGSGIGVDWYPLCSDMTPNFQCANIKPLYCSGGELIDNCKVCGCPSNKPVCDKVSSMCNRKPILPVEQDNI